MWASICTLLFLAFRPGKSRTSIHPGSAQYSLSTSLNMRCAMLLGLAAASVSSASVINGFVRRQNSGPGMLLHCCSIYR
jgi:hypothetical protein